MVLLALLWASSLAPPMGWTSRCGVGAKFDDAAVRSIASALVSTGLRDAGYAIVFLDRGGGALEEDLRGFGLRFGDARQVAPCVAISWRSVSDLGASKPGVLAVGTGTLSGEEERTHFTLWVMLAAPLLLGHDVRQTPAESLTILKNAEVIAVNQDGLGKQGYRAVKRGGDEVWMKPLSGGRWALAMFNLGERPSQVTAIWRDLKLPALVRMRDLWKHENWGKVQGGFSHRIEPHGCALFLLTP